MIAPVTKKILGFLALALPTLVLLAVVSVNLVRLENAPVMRVPVTGYDPVDILHGHYIQFQFDDQAFLDKPRNHHQLDCVCIHRTDPLSNGQNVRGAYVSCQKKDELQCDYWSANTAFFTTPHKYFFDERYAKPLDTLVREALPQRGRAPVSGRAGAQPAPQESPLPLSRVTMDVAILPSGAMKLKMLNIDGKPWKDRLGMHKID